MTSEKSRHRKNILPQSPSTFDYEGISKEYYLIPKRQPAPGDLLEESSESGDKGMGANKWSNGSPEAAIALFDSFIEELILDETLEPDLLFDLKYLIKDYIGKIYASSLDNVDEDLFPDDIFEEEDF